ncbi:MAG: VWA domain-containing protein, partial [Actinomycetota bacterium]|nr:VWA domain-containing protein [Actinomycetota bacterium]
MEADDVSPTRIEAAREAARNFVELAPAELEIGVVAFSGAAAGMLAPTTDRDAAAGAIDRLSLGDGTAIGEGIHAAVEMALSHRPSEAIGPEQGDGGGDGDSDDEDDPAEAIIVLSDGETTMGRPD